MGPPMKQLARKCKCGNVMIVSVGRGPILPRNIPLFVRSRRGYQKVSCVQGCQMEIYSGHSGRLIGPKTHPGGVTVSVLCSACSGVRRLSTFKELQV